MDKIIISDLEVHFQVGVTEAERANPQRLLVSLEMEHDFTRAAASDNLSATIDYEAVCRRLLHFGAGRQWQLIEKLAADIAQMILAEFAPASVSVEIKKFIIPQARCVAVRLERTK